MDFLESPVFPVCAAYGYQSGPTYSTNVAQASSGRERRNRNWSLPLYRITFALHREDTEIELALEHFNAMGGRECGFRFFDYLDYKSCRVRETPAATDQPLIAITSDPVLYQLAKEYKFGTRSQLRYIKKPRSGTIHVANEEGDEQDASLWSLDETTGLIVPAEGFVGTPSFWGGEFDVPVRYESDDLPFIIADKRVQSVSITLLELRL